jgi:hypothetical protein
MILQQIASRVFSSFLWQNNHNLMFCWWGRCFRHCWGFGGLCGCLLNVLNLCLLAGIQGHIKTKEWDEFVQECIWLLQMYKMACFADNNNFTISRTLIRCGFEQLCHLVTASRILFTSYSTILLTKFLLFCVCFVSLPMNNTGQRMSVLLSGSNMAFASFGGLMDL